jgi:hypothetical protein
MHAMQTLVVPLLVIGCGCYAVWKLMPSAARRALAASALKLPHLPSRVESALRQAAKAEAGCGCDGCDRADRKPAANVAAAAPATQPIRFHPRSRR